MWIEMLPKLWLRKSQVRGITRGNPWLGEPGDRPWVRVVPFAFFRMPPACLPASHSHLSPCPCPQVWGHGARYCARRFHIPHLIR